MATSRPRVKQSDAPDSETTHSPSSISKYTIRPFPKSVQNLPALGYACPGKALTYLTIWRVPLTVSLKILGQPPRDTHKNPSLGITVVTVYVYLRSVTFILLVTAEGGDY